MVAVLSWFRGQLKLQHPNCPGLFPAWGPCAVPGCFVVLRASCCCQSHTRAMFLLQPVRKPVPDEDAPVGEHLAGGGHLLVHVPPLPHPLCGTTASKCCCLPPTLNFQTEPNLGWGCRGSLVTPGFSFRLSSRSPLWTWRSGWWYWKSPSLSFCWMKLLNMWPVTTWNLVKMIVCGLPPNPVLCQHAPKEFPGRLCSLLCPWLSGFTAQTLTLVICSGLDWHGDEFYIQRRKKKSLT